jgi:predicted PurR-regulated permease PerM
VVGLAFVAVVGWLVTRFRQYLGPLILVLIITYLCYPIARFFQRTFKLPWRVSVTLFYLLFIVLLVGLLTLGGLAILEQGQSLLNFVQYASTVSIPDYINQLSTQVIVIGHFELDFTKLIPNASGVTSQLLSMIQPLFTQVGNIFKTVATSAVTFFGWVSFIILISYFVTTESGGTRTESILHEIPGYSSDIDRLSRHLNRIWNVFLRGQVTLFLFAVVVYSILLTVLGLRFSIGLALVAGLGRFLPYVGPFIAWSTLGLVAYFQGHTIFYLSPLWYVVLVIGVAMLTDSVFDNIISPKFMGSSLKVHPAAVLLTALVAANLMGFVGLIVAAPVLATIQLLGRYTLRKMFDLDPWEGIQLPANPVLPGLPPFVGQAWARVTTWQVWVRVSAWPVWQSASLKRFTSRPKPPPENPTTDQTR